jgi:hypothetical protein
MDSSRAMVASTLGTYMRVSAGDGQDPIDRSFGFFIIPELAVHVNRLHADALLLQFVG